MIKYTYKVLKPFAVYYGEFIDYTSAKKMEPKRGWTYLGLKNDAPKFQVRNAPYFDYADDTIEQSPATIAALSRNYLSLEAINKEWSD